MNQVEEQIRTIQTTIVMYNKIRANCYSNAEKLRLSDRINALNEALENLLSRQVSL